MALTSYLGALTAVLRASGEFLGRIDLDQLPMAFITAARSMPEEVSALSLYLEAPMRSYAVACSKFPASEPNCMYPEVSCPFVVH